MNCSVKPRTSTGTRGLRFACGFAALAALATTTLAAPPKITRLSVRGFQAGAATRVNVSGTGLEGDAKLLLTQPIKSQQIVTRRPDGVVFEVVFEVEINALFIPESRVALRYTSRVYVGSTRD